MSDALKITLALLVAMALLLVLAGRDVPRRPCVDEVFQLWAGPTCHSDADGEVRVVDGRAYFICTCRRGGTR